MGDWAWGFVVGGGPDGGGPGGSNRTDMRLL